MKAKRDDLNKFVGTQVQLLKCIFADFNSIIQKPDVFIWHKLHLWKNLENIELSRRF